VGKRKREHKKAVAEGREAPFRASPGKPEEKPAKPKTGSSFDDLRRRLGR